MEKGSTVNANSACEKDVKWNLLYVQQQKDWTKKCQTMEELQKQHLDLLDQVGEIHTKLTALTAREVSFEKERRSWRGREMFLESQLTAYEMNKCQTVGSVGETESREMESQTEETSQTVEQKFKDIQGENADLKDSVETLTTRLQECKQELVRFEIKQCQWRDRERFLEGKIKKYQKQMEADQGDAVERQFGEEATVKESRQWESASTSGTAATIQDRPQRETVDKPRTKEMEVQTDFTMQTIDDMEHEVEDVQYEFKQLVQSLRSEQVKFNQERAEWRAAEESLVEREKALEKEREEWSLNKEKSVQKEVEYNLKELQESLEEILAMAQKDCILEKERESLEKTVATQKSSFNASVSQWEKAPTSGTGATTETESELCADDSQATKQLDKSKDFENERERFSAREEELEMKIQLLESQVSELHKKAREDRPQRETVDKPCTKEMGDEREKVLELNLEKYQAMEQKVIILEKERESLEKTVELLKEQSTQKDEAKASASETPVKTYDYDPITQQQLNQEESERLSRKLEERERNEVRLEAERKEFERRAVEAETQLGKSRDDAVRAEKAFEEVEKHLNDLQKDNADLKSTVENLKGQRRALEASGANEELVSELRRQLKNEVTLREALHRFQWYREKYLTARQESLELEKEQWVMRANQSFKEKTRISAMFQEEREKTSRLEKEAEEAELKRGQMMQAFEDELRSREQEKEETERRYQQQLECSRQREKKALRRISELTDTEERLQTELEEAGDKYKELWAKEELWREARGRILGQIEALRADNERKKERKGFFSRVLGK